MCKVISIVEWKVALQMKEIARVQEHAKKLSHHMERINAALAKSKDKND